MNKLSDILDLTGPVVSDEESWIYDYLGMDAIAPTKVKTALDSDDDTLVVNLSSGGGQVTAASQIYTALRQSDKQIVVNITGMAASAASIIAMSGDEINISPTAQMMIHQASVGQTMGNKDDLSHLADILDTTDRSIAEAYVDRTNLPINDILQMMSNETFLSAKEAVSYHFADNVMFTEQEAKKTTNSIGMAMLPENAINKIGTMLLMQKEKQPSIENNNETSRLDEIASKAAILLEDK